jgi:hypothetical protein
MFTSALGRLFGGGGFGAAARAHEPTATASPPAPLARASRSSTATASRARRRGGFSAAEALGRRLQLAASLAQLDAAVRDAARPIAAPTPSSGPKASALELEWRRRWRPQSFRA